VNVSNPFTTIHGPKDGQRTWPRHRPGEQLRLCEARSFFVKKSSNFSRINMQSRSSLKFFFSKNPLNFTKNNPQSRPFKWAGLPPVRAYISRNWALLGRIRHDDVFLFSVKLLFIYNSTNFIKNIIKQIKIKNVKPSLLNSTQLALSTCFSVIFWLLMWI
jgi:hypothetical protein